ncbi:MAG TPA: fibronectin type III domain-containing protein [Caldisericia bacterium]|nr:fibronectin type III domain-containing protein [Caldisericia bacterium]
MKRLSLKLITIFVSVLLCSISFLQLYSPPKAQALVSSGVWTDITPNNRSLSAGQFAWYGDNQTQYGLHTPFAELVEQKPMSEGGKKDIHWFVAIPTTGMYSGNPKAAILHSVDKGKSWNDITPTDLYGSQVGFQVVKEQWFTDNNPQKSRWNSKLLLYSTKSTDTFNVAGYSNYRPNLYRYDGDGSTATWHSLINEETGSFAGDHTLGSAYYHRYYQYGIGFKAHLAIHNGKLFLLSFRLISNSNPASYVMTVHAFDGTLNQVVSSNSPLVFTQKWVSGTYSNYAYNPPAGIFYFKSLMGHLFIGTDRTTYASPWNGHQDSSSVFYQSNTTGDNFYTNFPPTPPPVGKPTTGRTRIPPYFTQSWMYFAHTTFTIDIGGTIYTARTDTNTQYLYQSWNYTSTLRYSWAETNYWNQWFKDKECTVQYIQDSNYPGQPDRILIQRINAYASPGTAIPITLEAYKGYLYGGFAQNANSVPGSSYPGPKIRRTNRVVDNLGNPCVYVNQTSGVRNVAQYFGNWRSCGNVVDPAFSSRNGSGNPLFGNNNAITALLKTTKPALGGGFEDDKLYISHSAGSWYTAQSWVGLFSTEGNLAPAPTFGRPTFTRTPINGSNVNTTFPIQIPPSPPYVPTHTAITNSSTRYFLYGSDYTPYITSWGPYYFNNFVNRDCLIQYTAGPGANEVTIQRIEFPAPSPGDDLLYKLEDDEWNYYDANLNHDPSINHYRGTGSQYNIYTAYDIQISSLGLVFMFTTPANKPAGEGHSSRRFRIFNAQPSIGVIADPNPLIIERGQSKDITFYLTPRGGFGQDGVKFNIQIPGQTGIYLPSKNSFGDEYPENKYFSQKMNNQGEPVFNASLYSYRLTPTDSINPTFRTTMSQPLGTFDAVLYIYDELTGLINPYPFKITVRPPAPGYTASVFPPNKQIRAGDSFCFDVNIETRFDFEDNVIIGIFWTNDAPPPPNNTSFEWKDSTYINNKMSDTIVEVFTRKNMGTQYQFCFHTQKDVTPGPYKFQLFFFSSVETQKITVPVQILPPQPTYQIQTMPVIGKAVPGGAVQYLVTVTSIDNFVGDVALHIENLPNTVQLVSLTPSTVNLSLGQPVAYADLILQTFSSIYAPDKPTNFYSKVISSSVINLSWTPSFKGTHDIAGYEIYRGPNEYIEKATKIADVGPNVVNYDDAQGIERGTTYVYFIRAYDNQVPPNYSEFVASNDATPLRSPSLSPQAVVADTGTLPGYYRFLVVGDAWGTDEWGNLYPMTVPADTDLLVYKQIDQMKTPSFDTWGMLALLLGLFVFMFIQKRKRESYDLQ